MNSYNILIKLHSHNETWITMTSVHNRDGLTLYDKKIMSWHIVFWNSRLKPFDVTIKTIFSIAHRTTGLCITYEIICLYLMRWLLHQWLWLNNNTQKYTAIHNNLIIIIVVIICHLNTYIGPSLMQYSENPSLISKSNPKNNVNLETWCMDWAQTITPQKMIHNESLVF